MTPLNGLTRREAVASDQQRCVAHSGENPGVGHGENRRTIQQDKVVLRSPADQQIAHPLRPQQLGRKRRCRATAEHRQRRQLRVLIHHRRNTVGQNRAQTRGVFRPNCACSTGQRRSASTNSTRAPDCANTPARFAVSLLFPSPATELVTSTTCGGCPSRKSCSEVRNERSASRNGAASYLVDSRLVKAREAGDNGPNSCSMPFLPGELECNHRDRQPSPSRLGTTPSRGPPSISSISSRERTLWS